MKCIRKYEIEVVLMIIVIVCAVAMILTCASTADIALANAQGDNSNVQILCDEFTNDVSLQGDASKTIHQYATYIDERFEIGNINAAAGITDEWIFQIVPKAVFDMQPDDFLYIGRQYGFYVDYDSEDASYLVYLMVHTYDNTTTSGHIVRRIEPLYYERYKYDSVTGTAALEYVMDRVPAVDEAGNATMKDRQYYKQCSKYEMIYLKDINFNGVLYNENHKNIGEDGYVAAADRGGYFIGGSYKFKGVSTNTHEFDFHADLFSTLIGWIDFSDIIGEVADLIGFAVDFAELLESGIGWATTIETDYRDVITNENDYTFSMTDIDAMDQIDKYEHLLKNYETSFETPNTVDGLLYKIGSGNYAQSTFYCNYADTNDRWNTSFAGTVSMDIVKGNGNITGNTVTALAEDVESNSFNGNVYRGERIDAMFDEQTELYTLPNGNVPLSFTAPVNGAYTFETSGDAQNAFSAPKGTVTAVGSNSKLVVRLEQGEVFHFTSQSFEDKRAIYAMSAKFTPARLGVGEETTLEIAPGETEYFCIDASQGDVYSWEISGGTVGVTQYYNNFDDPSAVYVASENPQGSLMAVSSGIYYYGITNNNSTTVSVDVRVDEPQDLLIGQNEANVSGYGTVFNIKSQYASAYNFSIVSAKSVNATIYSEDMVEILQESGSEINLSLFVSDSATYYLRLTCPEDAEVVCTLTPTPQSVHVGANSLQKTYNTGLYKLNSPETSVRLALSADVLDIKVYDASMTECSADGLFAEGEDYYIAVIGESASFVLNIVPVTSETQGMIGEDGFVMIAYTPVRTGDYAVEGAENIAWFNDSLSKCNGYLTAGQVYYLKVSGVANTSYSVQIEYDAPQLSLYVTQAVSAGYYAIDIPNADNYYFRLNCGMGRSAVGKLYDADHLLISTDITANDGQYVCELSPGRYYLEVAVEGGTQASVRIISETGTEGNRVQISEQIVSTNVAGTSVDGAIIEFEAKEPATYYLRLTDELPISYTIAVYKGAVEIGVVTINDQAGASDCTYVYAIQIEEKGHYLINIDVINAESFDCGVAIFIPLEITSIKLGDSYIYQDEVEASGVVLKMDSSYEIEVDYNSNATAPPSVCDIHGNDKYKAILSVNGDVGTNYELQVGFITLSKEEDSAVVLSFEDDFSPKEINCTIKYPYYATASLSENYDLVLVMQDESGAAVDPAVAKSVIIDCEVETLEYDELLEFNEEGNLKFNLITVPIVNYDGRQIEVSVILETVAGNEYAISLPKLQYNVFYRTLSSYTASAADGQARVVVDAQEASAALNKDLIIPDDVKAFFIVSDNVKVFENLQIEYQGSDAGFLYTENLKVSHIASILGDNFLKSSRSALTWKLVGENEITAKTSGYIIDAAGDIRFEGNGSLTVVGANGAHGSSSGASGGAGTNGLTCDRLILALDGGATLSITGGNGGNGSAGSNGSAGKAGNINGGNGGNGGSGGAGGNAVFANDSVSVVANFAGVVVLQGGKAGNGASGGNGGNGYIGTRSGDIDTTLGGNGGSGGIGGNGGSAGVGCNVSVTGDNVTVTDGYAGWGGNGGNGGAGGNGINASLRTWETVGVTKYIQGYARKASNGGDGGNGGAAGKNGSGTVSLDDNPDSLAYGCGGKGGNGGKGGDGVSFTYNTSAITELYTVAQACHGGNGGNGGDGFLYGGEGGRGGDGGMVQKEKMVHCL